MRTPVEIVKQFLDHVGVPEVMRQLVAEEDTYATAAPFRAGGHWKVQSDPWVWEFEV